MSEQPPLVPPSPPSPPGGQGPVETPAQARTAFEPYSAPAYGDASGEPPAYGAPGPYQVAPQYLTNPAAPTHSMAVTSLVLGIIGVVSVVLTPVLYVTILGGACSPFATWLGARARRELRQNPHLYSGEGLAVGGFVTGIIGTVLFVLGLVLVLLAVAFFAVLVSSIDA